VPEGFCVKISNMKYISLGNICWPNRSRKNLIIAGAGLFVLLILVVWLLLTFGNVKTDVNFLTVNHGPKFFSVLDGLPVTSTEAQTPGVVAVMIDNFPVARPQYGLAQAKVVYEVPVEGGLTRFMAMFDRGTNIARVGPVRSARPYFLDWQAEYGKPLYMHSGGSPEALSLIKKSDYFDANEFYFGQYYWRTSDSYAPHNLFTSSELWNKLALKFSTTTIVWSGRKFDNNAPASSSPASSVLIKYNSGYHIGWKFDSSQSVYERLLNNVLYSDASSEIINANNVVIQYVKIRSLDEVDRKEIVTIGSGSARVLRDGRIIYAQWQKDATESRTIFSDLNGEEIKFKPGVTWIQIVPWEVVVEVIN